MAYDFVEHVHKFACWAAATAARQSPHCRFQVERGKVIVEHVGLKEEFLEKPFFRTGADEFDLLHRRLRVSAIQYAKEILSNEYKSTFTHGVAAKLINVYAKLALIAQGQSACESALHVHPPIDLLLLRELSRQCEGDGRRYWASKASIGWSNFDAWDYEDAITKLRELVGPGNPLWTVEEHWRGHRESNASAVETRHADISDAKREGSRSGGLKDRMRSIMREHWTDIKSGKISPGELRKLCEAQLSISSAHSNTYYYSIKQELDH